MNKDLKSAILGILTGLIVITFVLGISLTVLRAEDYSQSFMGYNFSWVVTDTEPYYITYIRIKDPNGVISELVTKEEVSLLMTPTIELVRLRVREE